MELKRKFVTVGCNRVAEALDWGDNGLVAYGGHSIVCIYDPKRAEVIGTVNGHTGQVNCVKWIPLEVTSRVVADCWLLLSGGADGTIRVVAWWGESNCPPWTCLHALEGCGSPVTSLAIQPLSSTHLLLASTSAAEHIHTWVCDHSAAAAAPPGRAAATAAAVAGEAPGTAPAADPAPAAPAQRRGAERAPSAPPDPPASLAAAAAAFGAAAWRPGHPLHVGSKVQHSCALTPLPAQPGWLLLASGGTDGAVWLTPRAPGADGSFGASVRLTGHENWVRSLAFAAVRLGDGAQTALLLASASQDRFCRLWRIAASAGDQPAASGSGCSSLLEQITRYAPRPAISAGPVTYTCSLDALLGGHEDWVHSVAWRPLPRAALEQQHQRRQREAAPPRGGGAAACDGAAPNGAAASDGAAPNGAASGGGGSSAQAVPLEAMCLLSASQDRTMGLWRYDAGAGIWLNAASLGDAGASCLGYYGAAFGPDGDEVLAHGFTGALHLWRWRPDGGGGGERGRWEPAHALGGHYGAVVDLCWGADGRCLQSVSADQTARLFTDVGGSWCELARTQVHGHDFACIAAIPDGAGGGAVAAGEGWAAGDAAGGGGCYLYVSGSEEKVLRVFEAPQAFLDTLALAHGGADANGVAAPAPARARALGAAVGALGLSNKAVYADGGEDGGSAGGGGGGGGGFGAESYPDGPDFAPCAAPAVVSGPPLEEHLAQSTLWPETRKLYGHGNDVYCVAASPDGTLLASACRAQSAAAAAVWVWQVGSWRALTQLAGHTLTVTQLAFSGCGRHLLAGSRDRSWSVWSVPSSTSQQQQHRGGGGGGGAHAAAGDEQLQGGFRLLARVRGAHARVIWGVSWAHDGAFFATCSRDQSVKLWAMAGRQPATAAMAMLPAFGGPVTAVALAPAATCAAAAAALGLGDGGGGGAAGRCHLLAVGLEDGHVQVWQVLLPPQEQEGQQQQPPPTQGGGDQQQQAARHPGQQPGQEQLDLPGRRGQAEQGLRLDAAPAREVGPGAAQRPGGPGLEVRQLWGSREWERHAAPVRRLAWGPRGSAAAGQPPLLASCGEDHSVRLLQVVM